jgi:pimeloyl-ACP methyl ester carboxylesterase
MPHAGTETDRFLLQEFAMSARRIATVIALASVALGGAILAQPRTPRLEAAECPFAREGWAAPVKAECRWLVVPQDRDRVDGPSVRLFVVVLRPAQTSTQPPLVMLHGGPGESALLPMVRGAARRGPPHRELVIYDQRGAGLSEPDPCPAYPSRVHELHANEVLGSTRSDALEAIARECVASMRARDIAPAAYSTTANAADLVDLRLALRYERWDLYGASYGARLALEAMRRDPRGIRAVVLENPLPPGPESAEAPMSTQFVLERVFAACGRSAACNAAFPRLEQTFLAVFDTLSRSPVAAPAAEASTQRPALDGEGLVNGTRRLLRSRDGIVRLPLLLHELQRGDRSRAAHELVRLADASPGRPVRASFWLVQCHDQYGPAYRARLDSVRASVWRPLRGMRDNLQQCPLWQTRFATADDGAPVMSEIPTLVLTGEFDARTPIEFGRRIATTLSRSYMFELPGETHGGQPTGCRALILARFLDNPERLPDGSCIGQMPPLEFLTQWP